MDFPTRAITIKQPWAELIALGIKDIENRTWNTKRRGRVFIHSSLMDDTNHRLTDAQEQATDHIEEFNFNRGCIIGEVTIEDCVENHSSIWAEKGVKHIVLKNAIMYKKPIAGIKGALGFWEPKLNNEQLQLLNENY